jgi:hypothetical protein
MSSNPAAAISGLHWSDDGCAALDGALLRKAIELDGVFRRWAAAQGAVEHRFPATIAAADLEPVAWLRSFPHLATFVTSADRRRPALEALAKGVAHGASVPIRTDVLEPITHLLVPATCYHFYPRLAGRRLEAPLLLTAASQCHRREDRYEPLRRQWCFSMREIVCIGDRRSVERFTARCRRLLDAFVKRLGIDADWRSATDPFFDPDHDPKALAQRVEPVKQELCLADGLAIASSNGHRTFFGDCYDIRIGDEAAHSGCVAFGIERWLFALAQRFGGEAGEWPLLGGSR